LVAGGFDALRDLRSGGTVRAIGAGANNVKGVISEFLDHFDRDIFPLLALTHWWIKESFTTSSAGLKKSELA
jgi:hypothetical protein